MSLFIIWKIAQDMLCKPNIVRRTNLSQTFLLMVFQEIDTHEYSPFYLTPLPLYTLSNGDSSHQYIHHTEIAVRDTSGMR